VTPEAIVPRIDRARSWSRASALALRRAADGAVPLQPTTVRVGYDDRALLVRFDCDDRDIWATHTERDAPLWEEEAVEVFIAPGDADPQAYVELEVNPLGAIFDARVSNPDARRDSMRVDAAWNAAGLVVRVDRPSPGSWGAELEIDWSDFCAGPPPRVWRANFFRIERPRGGDPEFSCWSPSFTDPADFHKPARFGRLILDGAEDRP